MNETVERVALLRCATALNEFIRFAKPRGPDGHHEMPACPSAAMQEAMEAANLARAAIAAMPERGIDPFMVDNFAAMWTDWADADWQLVTDPTTFLEQCEDAGLAECVEVDEDALDDAFAAERGIEPGGMMWRLTDAGRARYAATLPTPPEPTT